MIMRVLLLLTVLAAVQARAYYDAIVIDAESRTDDGEETSYRRTFEDCLHPKETGHCRAFFQSYYFNMKTKKCEQFVYSGCGGNNNRFETLEECKKLCSIKRKEDLTVTGNRKCNQDASPPVCNKGCSIVLDNNNCPKCQCHKGKHHYPKKYLDARKTYSEGKSTRKHDIVCSLPAVRGHCRALLPRWRYDPEAGKCTEFKFGGCDGNGNNFMTEHQCMRTCRGFRSLA
ncbi:hypothetical protein L9F63_007443 [Diploptera punctata]|uniref:BPTI/Kunitz inhibitor domain-containing protein n=1 Tax=Diploptera punctata TaxID=6984 RepID=A0AAD8E3R8_DIPPU|nr:hypothetical protein L9F63_007443 [Diploptera punctata]